VSLDAIADAAIEATYTALGLTATWVPVYGAAFAIPVHLGQAPQLLDGLGGGRHLADGIIAEVRVADLPAGSPGENDQLLLGSRRWRVRSARYKDPNMLVWLLDCVPA
jgi:hypothetical protein